MIDNTTATDTANPPANIDELEQKIAVSLLQKISQAEDKQLASLIGTYAEFQAACYRRAYIAQIGKLPAAPASQP